MLAKEHLKQILLSNQTDVEGFEIVQRAIPGDDFMRRVFVGLRRSGKSFMLYQKMQEMLADGRTWADMLYLNFEDSRLEGFSKDDFEKILECHSELYGKRPMLFLDEIQNIDGWERFARRLADAKYSVWITGSNAKMLSREIQSALGARFMTTEVYPYSYVEYLDTLRIPHDGKAILKNDSRAALIRHCDEYLHWGGLPEAVGMKIKRDYINSTLQKIYLGDICDRNKVASTSVLRLLLKKLADTVCRPVSYSRLAQLLSAISGKVTMPTVSKYIEYAEDAWLLLRLRNITAPFAEKGTISKYYFADNGVLNLFLIDGETALLENMVALALFRKYGHDANNERVFFYNGRVEVDFYVPEDQLAIQVSYSIEANPETYNREVGALRKISNVLDCRRRLIITKDESDTLNDEYGRIEVLPLWRFLLEECG